MKFYRVSYATDGGNSAGFSWHTSQREARAAAVRDYEQDPSEYDGLPGASIDERVDEIEIIPTKAGILAALKRFASHPDNG